MIFFFNFSLVQSYLLDNLNFYSCVLTFLSIKISFFNDFQNKFCLDILPHSVPSDVSRVLSLVEKKEKAEKEGNETKDEEKEKDPLNVAIKTLSLPISAVRYSLKGVWGGGGGI